MARICGKCGREIRDHETCLIRDGLLDYPESNEYRREILCADCGADDLAKIEEANRNPVTVDKTLMIDPEIWDALERAVNS